MIVTLGLWERPTELSSAAMEARFSDLIDVGVAILDAPVSASTSELIAGLDNPDDDLDDRPVAARVVGRVS